MFLGPTKHKESGDAHDYESAAKVLAAASKTPTGRARKEQDYGFPLGRISKSVTWVRKDKDGVIVFRLYDTDVVLWYPDNSIDVDNYGTVSTTSFAAQFLPNSIAFQHPTYRRGSERGHKTITYLPHGGTRWQDERICAGGVARFLPQGNSWAPDETTLNKIVLPVIDLKGARELSKKYHLKDFRTWLTMAPRHMEIEHLGWDVEDCAAALLKRDFRTAAQHIPPIIDDGTQWGRDLSTHALPFTNLTRDEVITPGCVDKVKMGLMDLDGLIKTEEVKTMRRKDYAKRMTVVRELERLDAAGYSFYGPQS